MLKAFTTTIGAGTGFALGGPFGALIGATMGFVVGSALKGKKENGGQDQRQQESGN